MRTYEDECVGCPTGMGCLGKSCPYKNVERIYCDVCGCDSYEMYKVDGDDMCEECAEKYLQDIWDELTIEEKAELLDVDFSKMLE